MAANGTMHHYVRVGDAEVWCGQPGVPASAVGERDGLAVKILPLTNPVVAVAAVLGTRRNGRLEGSSDILVVVAYH